MAHDHLELNLSLAHSVTRCLLHNDPTTLFFQLKLKPIGVGVDTSNIFQKIINYFNSFNFLV